MCIPGTVALRLIRRAFHQIDVTLTRWIAPLPKNALQADSADLVGFRTFFRRLPSDAAARDYMDVHLPRLVRTMTLVPKPAGVAARARAGLLCIRDHAGPLSPLWVSGSSRR